MSELSGSRKTWLIVGASRGIGREFVCQLLNNGQHVLATVRGPTSVEQLWNNADREGKSLALFKCDMMDDASIDV
jgi:short-subunit dehydrogenase